MHESVSSDYNVIVFPFREGSRVSRDKSFFSNVAGLRRVLYLHGVEELHELDGRALRELYSGAHEFIEL
jgi:hypothetical protein